MDVNISAIISLFSLVIVFFTMIGGFMAFRYGKARAEQDIQERVRTALHDENDLLQAQVRRLEAEVKHLRILMKTITTILKKTSNIEIEIVEDVVTLRDATGMHVSSIDDSLTGT